MSNELLISKKDNGVALVTLSRAKAMNALSASLRAALNIAMIDLRDDDSIRVVILTGEGERAFCAGLDLKELGGDSANLDAATDQNPVSNPVNAIRQCGKPVIGAINGVAITGGFELALACDILIASSNARFADTHSRVGIMPGWGLSQKLSRIIGMSRAKEMSFSGRFITAETACEWGIVNRVVAADQLIPEAISLAEDIAAVEPDFIQNYQHLIEHGATLPLPDALAYESTFSTGLNAGVSPEDIESRRQQVMARGRSQS